MKAEGIFAVVGMPYSGSTLLSFILGCNEKVYNGSDLHHLNGERKGVCSMHKDKCPVFDKAALEKVYGAFSNCDDWYDSIANATGRPYIFDASKQLSFFKEVLPKTNKKVVVIALNKHPIRALSSDIYNRLFARQLKMETLPEIRQYMISNVKEVQAFISKRLDALVADIEQRAALLESVKSRENIIEIMHLSYETYVENPEETFTEILSLYGLNYDSSFIDYTNFEHHPVTGNMAPIWKVKNSGKVAKIDEKNFRKSFYLKDSSSIVIDNKYRDLFSVKEITWIESQPQYKVLLDVLGYDPMQPPSLLRRLASLFS
jgi:hypothetical protein